MSSNVVLLLISTPSPFWARPFLVVIRITPLDARTPYRAAAGPPFRTLMDSMSSGLMPPIPSPRSTFMPLPSGAVPPPGMLLSIGIPLMTYKGWLLPLSEPLPRIIMRLEPPGPVAMPVAFTPAILPVRALATLFSRACVNSLPFTSVTAYDRAFFSFEMPNAVTTTSLSVLDSGVKLTERAV